MRYFVFIILLYFYSCKEDYCPDTISELNKKIPYKTGDIIKFNDSLSNIKYDTIKTVFLDKVDYERYEKVKDDEYYAWRKCEATSFFNYSNLFTIIVKQGCDICSLNNLIIGHLGYMYKDSFGFWSNYDYTYNYSYDTLNYTFQNKQYKALRYYYTKDSIDSDIWKTQTELTKQNSFIYNYYVFIYEDEIKLVEYSTIDSLHNRKRWFLVE